MAQIPSTRVARQAKILELLERTKVYSQTHLAELLRPEGFVATQATLSRDLDELGVRKIRNRAARSFYSISPQEDSAGPREKLRRMIQELAVSTDSSGNIAVLRTPPGAGQYLASFVDRVDLEDIVGCVAGDDTVFILARDPMTGEELRRLLAGGEDA
ncbi:arginine repressor [Corynebacterium uberis]|uniref:arginine repressor n=1 Tax=Corynebacterium TaxID=1716 RepID=UPI002010E621|nr:MULTISPECIES: arginine repressor [Corynebacterium]MCZ9309172.1 arginine repressor [Corynebacterium sp. c6VSa_13]